MARCYFPIKAFTTAALLFFAFKITHYAVDVIDFVWAVKCSTHEDSDSEEQDSVFEDLDTEEFPLLEKCPTPPPFEPPPPPYENN